MQRRRPPKRKKKTEVRTLEIEAMNSVGEGLAGRAAVPFALPGETVTAALSGRKALPRSRQVTSPKRAEPRCPHFGLPGDGCGGCTLQHLGEEEALGLKKERLLGAVRSVYGAAELAAVHRSPAKSRRRAKLSVTPEAAGFRQLGGGRIVGLRACDVLRSEIFSLLSPLRGLARQLTLSFTAEVTLTGAGMDLALVTGGAEPHLQLLSSLSAFADAQDLARLSLDGVPVSERRVPYAEFGGVPVTMPPGAFLQATLEGEAALQAEVLAACDGAGAVADLFSGLGTFALPLSRRAKVLAADSAGAASEALGAAAKGAGLPVRVQARDLYRRPMAAKELAVDAVVFDPPRAGAGPQAEEIVQAGPEVAVAVSCDPSSLAKDLRAFAATYALTRLVLVDQFGWSPHVEGVAVLRKR